MTYIKDHILNNDCCGLILAFWQYVFGGMLSLLIGRVERNSNPKVVTVKARIFSDPRRLRIASLSLHNEDAHSLAGEIDRQPSSNLGCKRV